MIRHCLEVRKTIEFSRQGEIPCLRETTLQESFQRRPPSSQNGVNTANLVNFLHHCFRCKEKRTPVTGPQVSVILPCYEGERWLRRAIESVTAQAGVFWEFVMVDDGYSVSPEGIVKSFQDERIAFTECLMSGRAQP